MASLTTKTVVEDVTRSDGSIDTVETVITYGRVKTAVLRRSQMQPFGRVSLDEAQSVTGYEKAIEIRCFPPQVVQDETTEGVPTGLSDSLFDVQSTIQRCKLCGMEGHFSLRCPKRKEIEVRPVASELEQPREISILLSNVSEMVTEDELFTLIYSLRGSINQELQRLADDHKLYYSPVRSIRPSFPRERSRNIAFINIVQTPTPRGMSTINTDTEKHFNFTTTTWSETDQPSCATLFAEKLVAALYRQQIGHSIIEAEIKDQKRDAKRRPNKYDDEERWGSGDRYSKR
jgi:hypothetical protein